MSRVLGNTSVLSNPVFFIHFWHVWSEKGTEVDVGKTLLQTDSSNNQLDYRSPNMFPPSPGVLLVDVLRKECFYSLGLGQIDAESGDEEGWRWEQSAAAAAAAGSSVWTDKA